VSERNMPFADEPETILVVEDEPDILAFIETTLQLEGFKVIGATDGLQAFERAVTASPDLVLLDVMIPHMDGYEVCQRLRADSRTRNVSIIMLTAKSLPADKVVGLTAGADDYIGKPFDPVELVARIKSQLRRARDLRAVSPVTGLPGNAQIEHEIHRRLSGGDRIAVTYADLDNFKAYNDRYGYLRGDEAIMSTAEVLRSAFSAWDDCFLGHIGGDDFVCVSTARDLDEIERLCRDIIQRFEAQVPSLYDPADAAAGAIEVSDRRGNEVLYPLLTISIGVAHNLLRDFKDHRELVAVATEMKNFAKRREGDGFAIDRRSE
jgi:diguanylate cyclase (GGDEF)-like protein